MKRQGQRKIQKKIAEIEQKVVKHQPLSPGEAMDLLRCVRKLQATLSFLRDEVKFAHTGNLNG